MTETQFDVFLSNAHRDSSVAAALAKALKKKGLRVWYDQEQVRLGDSFLRDIEYALEHSHCFLLLISPHYSRSQWSNFEMGVALSRAREGHRIVPVFIGDIDSLALPPYVRHFQGFHVKDAKDFCADEMASKIAEVLKQDEINPIDAKKPRLLTG